ncbi:hypothetical protein D3C74_404300 [compost metagenome]
MAQREALVEPGCGEKQTRDELARPRRVDVDRAAAHRAVARDGEGQGALALDGHAQVAQRVEHGAHGPHTGALVAVEPHGAVGQGRDRGHEAHDRAREPAVDLGRAAQ